MKYVDGWAVPDHMNNPGSHLRRSAVIPHAVSFLLADRRRNVVQAGGHLGIWPKTLASLFEMVYTFEPVPQNFECLQANIVDLTNVRATPGCVGDKNGTVAMHFSERNTGKHCVVKGGGDLTSRIERIDDMGLEHLDALFLDIEGYEWHAIMGAEETIARNKPLIVVEQNGLGSRYGHSDDLLSRLLRKIGYNEVGEFEEDVIYVHGK